MAGEINSMHRANRQAGVTLVELMIALLILSVLVMVTVPGFDTLLRNNRLYTQVNDFHLSLMRARAEAMSRVARVTVCVADVSDPNNPSCTNTGRWEEGWIVFVEDFSTQNASVDSGEEILEIQQAISGGNTLRGSTNVADYVSYAGTGFSTTSTGTVLTGKWTLCDRRGVGSGRDILINAAGRPRVVDATTSCTSP